MNFKSFFPFIIIIFLLPVLGFIQLENNTEKNQKLVELGDDFYTTSDLITSYKTKTIKEVFKKLKMAKGDFRSAKPKLNFVKEIPNNGRIAIAYPTVGVIYFEEKMYDVCISVGQDSLNALAAILSHELTHCYENHTWEDNFKKDFKQTQMDSVLRDHYMDDEIQADYLGGFLAYTAGFQPFGVMEKLYEKEYEAYNLTDKALEGDYPPMQERIQIAQKSEEKLKSLIDYFEMANLLTAVGEYEDALAYYNAIEGEFQSREIYNNIGVVSVLSVLKKLGPNMRYAFPVELDVNSRLNGSKGIYDELTEKLREAIEYFEKAKSLDAFYPIAQLNLGCAQALLGAISDEYQDLEYDEAEIAAKRAIRLAKGDDAQDWSKTIVDANILLGLIEALRNESEIGPIIKEITNLQKENKTDEVTQKMPLLNEASELAIEYLDKALKLDSMSQLAKYNKTKLECIASKKRPLISQIVTAREIIEGKEIVELRASKKNIKKDLYLKPGMIFAVKNYPKSQLLINNVSGENKHTINFYLTSLEYDEPTKQSIKINDDYNTVVSKYPNPPNPIGLGDGYFLVYQTPNIIFQFDNNHKLRRWAIYRRQ